MNIREFKPSDMDAIIRIHKTYYSDFELPEFNKALSAFTILDKDENIITIGTVELLAELVLLTDKSKSLISIGRALKEAQKISLYVADRFKVTEILAFTDDVKYAKHLKFNGFYNRGNALAMRSNHG